jgi:hypothetical protein
MSRVYDRLTKLSSEGGPMGFANPTTAEGRGLFAQRLKDQAKGAVPGALIGGAIGAYKGKARLGAGVGALVGLAGGQAVGDIRRWKNDDKSASADIAEYSALFDTIADGHLGEATKEALAGVCEVYDNVYSSPLEKVATLSNEDSKLLTETEARSSRLDQLLRR